MRELLSTTAAARTFAELETAVQKALGRTGLMMFMKLDLGAILRKETGLDTPKIIRFLIGNPLIMKEMAKHVPDAGSYAPVTILVDERSDGVHLSYDGMASFLAAYGNPNALAVARWVGFENRGPPASRCGLIQGETHGKARRKDRPHYRCQQRHRPRPTA